MCDGSEVMVDLAGAGPLKNVVGGPHLTFSLVSKLINTIATVQSAADLFISLNKSLEFNSQISVLINENIAMVLKSIDLTLNIGISALKVLVRETKVILLTLGTVELLISVTALSLQLTKLGSELLVAATFSLKSSKQVILLSHLAIKGALLSALLFLKASCIISRFAKLNVSGIESFTSLFEFEVFVL